jgi:LPS O-antigen subunit length determinant protein (WzzB/FepE family)
MSKTSLLEIRSSINDVIESQLKTQMMAKVREDYVLKLIEPPFYPEVKFSPNRPLISILGTLLGLMAGTIFVVVRFYVFYQERKDN